MSVVFKPVQRLEVWRTLGHGERVLAGTLAQNRQGVYFQYAEDYLRRLESLSPFALAWSDAVQAAPQAPHGGLHGVFADALPDGWGLLLMDRVFRQHGVMPAQVTAMDRLAFVGASALGALSFEPVSPFAPHGINDGLDVQSLGLQAQSVFDGHTEDVLAALVAVGSSGGARPKAQVYFPAGDWRCARAVPQAGDEAWMVKFTSSQLALGHEEGVCEAVYLSLAARAGIEVPHWQLLPAPLASGAAHWLAVQRFDVVHAEQGVSGRRHLHSACGLLDADFRSPSLDYEDLIKASSLLCRSPLAGQQMFRRALFNLFAVNQDDHSKNWAFLHTGGLATGASAWSLAPFFDVTFSPHAFGEHATAFAGFGKNPPRKALEGLARQANFASWREVKTELEAVLSALADFARVARDLDVKPATRELIEQRLNQAYRENKGLLG